MCSLIRELTVVLLQRCYNVMTIWQRKIRSCSTTCVYWKCFQELFSLVKKYNPLSTTLPYQRSPWDSSRSCVLLTVVRKSYTPDEAEVLDTDADRMIQKLCRWIVLQRKRCFLCEQVHWKNHFQRYYYNERTVVIFI